MHHLLHKKITQMCKISLKNYTIVYTFVEKNVQLLINWLKITGKVPNKEIMPRYGNSFLFTSLAKYWFGFAIQKLFSIFVPTFGIKGIYASLK